MSTKPPSLGDAYKGLRRVKKHVPLPNSREEIIAEFSKIIGLGFVQKIVLELGKPITYERLVREDELPDLPQEIDEDLFYEARNAEMYDYSKPLKITNFEYLFKAFSILSQRRLKPQSFIVKSLKELNLWLGLEEFVQLPDLFGIPVFIDHRLPEGVALMTATKSAAEQNIALSIRLTLDSPKGKA